MDKPIHVAITRKVRRPRLAEFERALMRFASRSLAEDGARGVHVLYPPPGSPSNEYGILRTFASEAECAAFYETPLYKQWLEDIEPLVEGAPRYRRLSGLETWFHGQGNPPPRWKMALLTWIAVWPVSMLVAAIVGPLSAGLPELLKGGLIAGGIVLTLTWGAMPILVKAAHTWLHPDPDQDAPHQR